MLNESLFKKGLHYELKSGKYIFKKYESSDIVDGLDKFKNKLKSFPGLYYFLIQLLSPVYVDRNLKKFLKKNSKVQKLVLNLGSGNSKISANVLNVDIFAYDNVDIVCDIADLPFVDNSIDTIINLAVLEHVPEPELVINEIYRVLKTDGIIYTAFPFIQGFHASPFDYTRVTFEGIKELHKKFEKIEVKPFGGPTSGMLWVFQEWAAILFSLGSRRAYFMILILLMLLTFPIKFLDMLLLRHPMARNIASGFIFIGRKHDSIQ